MGSLTKQLIGKEDFSVQNNTNDPEQFSRLNSVGGTINLYQIPDMWTYTGALRPGDIITKGPWVDVRAYGAKGDGVTDDTAASQAAIDSISKGIIFFPAGIHIVTEIYYKSNIVFQGSGIGITTLKLKAATNKPIFGRLDEYLGDDWPTVNALAEITNVEIRDMTLDGNGVNQTAPGAGDFDSLIWFQRVTSGRVTGCEIKNGRAGGIALNQSRKCIISDNIVTNCIISPNGRNQVYGFRDFTVGTTKYNGNIFTRNIIDANEQNYCITSEYTYNDTIAYNKCTDGSIGGESSFNLDISHNFLVGTNGQIHISDTDTVSPTGNIISHNILYNSTISSTIAGGWALGIMAFDNPSVQIINNVISGATKTGTGPTWGYILIGGAGAGCPNALISGNKILNPTAYTDVLGIYVTNSNKAKIQNNDVYVNDFDGIQAGSDDLDISSNTFLNAKVTPHDNGIYISGSRNFVDKNTIVNFVYGISADVVATGNNIIGNNTYTTCTNAIYEQAQGSAIYGLVGTQKIYKAAAAPAAGTWTVGDICWTTTPVVGQPIGWLCTVTGTPGTWVAMANL